MDCSLPGSFIHGIFQATVLEWGAIAFSENQLRYQKKKKKKMFGHGEEDNKEKLKKKIIYFSTTEISKFNFIA